MTDNLPSVIECPCGAVLEGPNSNDVADMAQTHAKETHDMDLSRDQALAMVRPG